MKKLIIVCLLVSQHIVGITDFVKERVESYMERNGIPGVAVALYYDGQSHLLSYGEADLLTGSKVSERTIFELASLGKCFVSTILAYGVLDDSMKLDDTLDQYFPYLQKNPSNLCEVTLKSLATHTSGLPSNSSLPPSSITETKLLESFEDWVPKYPIGTHYLYSNVGYHILRFALENHWSMDYPKLAKALILDPLKMDSTFHCIPSSYEKYHAQGYDVNGNPVPRTNSCNIEATGALHSTSADMLQFLEANLQISGPSALMSAMELTQREYFRVNDFMVQGLAWERIRPKSFLVVDKNGGIGGFSTWIGMIPGLKIGIVLLTKRRCDRLTGFSRDLISDLGSKFVSSKSCWHKLSVFAIKLVTKIASLRTYW